MMHIHNNEKRFNILMKISLIIYLIILILTVMFKTFMPNSLIESYNFLSNFTLEERFFRGINLIEFYKIEYELGIITKTIILDILNCIIFIPFGILISNQIKKNKIIKSILLTLIISIFIETFQLITIIGSFMLNDLITNIIGGLIGSILYILITRKKKYNIYIILLSIFLLIELILVSYLLINLIINIDVYKIFL